MLKSNYKDFIRRINSIPNALETSMSETVETVLKQMCEDMKNELSYAKSYWMDNGGLEAVYNASGGEDIEYESFGYTGTIYVGRNTPELTVGKDNNQRKVNPYLFIQFGFGIVGEENPMPYAKQRRWEYNINGHTKAWWFMGINGEKQATAGQKGYDFFYSVIKKYRQNWKNIAKESFLKRLGF
jgi:hypothetical protein